MRAVVLLLLPFWYIGCSTEGKLEGSYLSARPVTELPGGFDDRSRAFREYFQHVRTVRFSDSVLVSDITHLDVDDRGRFLVTEGLSGDKVHLFGPDGSFIRSLSAEACHPGFNWHPRRAAFNRDGRILLINAGPWGYRFDAEGNCAGGMHDEFTPPTWPAFDEEGHIYGFYRNPAEGYHIRKMTPEGLELDRFAEATAQKIFIGQFSSGGLVSGGKHIYLALPTWPHVFKFDLSGNFAGKLGWSPDGYRRIEGDIPRSGDAGQISQNLGALREGKSLTTNLYLLDQDKIMVGYWHNHLHESDPEKRYAFAAMDTAGRPLMPAVTMKERTFIFARDGLAYRRVEQSMAADGTVPNPGVEVYRYVGPGS